MSKTFSTDTQGLVMTPSDNAVAHASGRSHVSEVMPIDVRSGAVESVCDRVNNVQTHNFTLSSFQIVFIDGRAVRRDAAAIMNLV